MALITYPLLTVTDDAGAVVGGATVTVASVKDRAGTDVASPAATVYQSGPNVSVEYDAEAKGEAWVTLAVSKSGSTFSGQNAAPSFYLARDSSRVLGNLPAAGPLTANVTQIGGQGATAAAPVAFPAAVSGFAGGAVTLAAGAITDATFAAANEAANPTGVVQFLHWLMRWYALLGGSVKTGTVAGSLVVKKANNTTWTSQPYIADPVTGTQTLGPPS